MHHAARAFAILASLAACSLLSGGSGRAAGAAGSEQDQYEEARVDRLAGRVIQFQNTERGLWMKELEAAFPGRVTDATKAAEYGEWFELLSGGGTEWRRADAPTTGIAALFDKVRDRQRLGPVPTIQKQEFLRYASRVLIREVRRAQQRIPNPDEEADRVFRVLDADRDGVIDRAEMTTQLRENRQRADTDLNGRVDQDEYRQYFRYRVRVRVETAPTEKADDRSGQRPATGSTDKLTKADELPGWFTELDADQDRQVELHEWRKAGRLLGSFTEMDLNGDGLLTREEYLRFAEQTKKQSPDEIPPGGEER